VNAPAAPSLPAATAVVCHDAGACNVILPWLDDAGRGLRAVMQGPALPLFRARYARRPLCALAKAIAGAELVLTGTGWASDLEHRARALARAQGVRSAALLDHWVNYRERFERGGEVIWPDEFWVTDEEAEAIARRLFKGAPIRRYANPYLQSQAALIPREVPAAGGVLYVLEPARSDWGRDRPGEFQALDVFIARRGELGIGAEVPIRLRPHPSDPPGKYDAWIAAQRGASDVALDRHANLHEAISAARWVVGLESMALVLALMAGREVISSLPPWAPACRLPHPGIRRLGEAAA
jgi:hypothetical protein